MVSPYFCPRAGKPQGTLLEVRIGDDQKSECRAVTARIGIEPKGDIIPRESGQTLIWSFLTRAFDEPLQEGSK